MLRANMELEDSMEESAEDMAAAETAPRPTYDTHWIEINSCLVIQGERNQKYSDIFTAGVRYCRTRGNIIFPFSSAVTFMLPFVAILQSKCFSFKKC